jgi:hypothetical protein
MEHTNDSILVKVSDLVPSPFNVRRHSPTSVEELAAPIDSQGLLHPLTVNEHEVGRSRSRRVKFAVPAGERRRRALLALAGAGPAAGPEDLLPNDHPGRVLDWSTEPKNSAVNSLLGWMWGRALSKNCNPRQD